MVGLEKGDSWLLMFGVLFGVGKVLFAFLFVFCFSFWTLFHAVSSRMPLPFAGPSSKYHGWTSLARQNRLLKLVAH
jgi:hypothetical protein